MCSEFQPKGGMKKVTLVMADGQEIGPVKVSGEVDEVGGLLKAKVYASPSVLPNSLPSILRFLAVYTNFNDRTGPK
jgi:hypothetical protein